MFKQYDIIVVGGSIVGLTFALASAPSGLKIAVVEAGSSTPTPEGDARPRVSALGVASINAFANIGVWPLLNQDRVTPYTDMSVWEKDSFAAIDFSADSVTQSSLGSIVENDNLIAALQKKCSNTANIDVIYQAKITQIDLDYPNHHVQLESGEHLLTKFLVGADGGRSSVRHKVAFPITYWSYGQDAIVATVKTELPHEACARQAFTPTGPLAFLPLWDEHQCSIVWSQDTERAQILMALDDAEFEKLLLTALDNKLGKVELVTPRFQFPLTMQYARQWVADGVAIIGDAAHTIHPLAGQGANLGILDALWLAEHVTETAENEQEFSTQQSMRAFERARKSEATKMVATMEGFKQLFSGDNPAKKLVRGLGMSAVNVLSPVKHTFVQQAMGISDELPSQCKSR